MFWLFALLAPKSLCPFWNLLISAFISHFPAWTTSSVWLTWPLSPKSTVTTKPVKLKKFGATRPPAAGEITGWQFTRAALVRKVNKSLTELQKSSAGMWKRAGKKTISFNSSLYVRAARQKPLLAKRKWQPGWTLGFERQYLKNSEHNERIVWPNSSLLSGYHSP